MNAEFIELPAFERRRADYLNDDDFAVLQEMLNDNPEAGVVVQGTGGLRKVRFADRRRSKGKRGGLRVIYYWWSREEHIYLFDVFSKNEMSDMSSTQKNKFKVILKNIFNENK